jgi:hypothetical protein
VSGERGSARATDGRFLLMARSMKASGTRIPLMDRARLSFRMGSLILESGTITHRLALGLKFIKIRRGMRGILAMGLNKARESSSGRMVRTTRGSFIRTLYMVQVT